MDKAIRLFLILYEKRKCTYRELAERCEISTRTAMRIVDALTPYIPITVERGRWGGKTSRKL